MRDVDTYEPDTTRPAAPAAANDWCWWEQEECSDAERFDTASFGHRVTRARSDAGASAPALARELGWSTERYQQLESGAVAPSEITSTLVDQMSRRLGVSMLYLITGAN